MNKKIHDSITKVQLRILSWFCPDHLYEEIEGDLIQRFEKDVKIFGDRKAKRKFLWNTIRFFRPGIILRSKQAFEFTQLNMLQNYFKITFRHLMRSKVFTLINTVGLSIGIVAFYLILQYVSFERSYDQFYENKKEIYRLTYSKYENDELKNTSAKHYLGIRGLLKDNFPELKAFTVFEAVSSNTGFLFGYNDKMYLESGGYFYADSSFFKVFPSLLIRGNAATVLQDSTSLVISEKMAKKIFGDKEPLGEQLIDHQSSASFTITGVFKDLPENSHLEVNFLSFMGSSYLCDQDCWSSPDLYAYVTLDEEATTNPIEERLNYLFASLSKERPELSGVKMSLQPIADVHLNPSIKDEMKPSGNIVLIYLLSLVGFIILCMAWINYVNMETSQFITRCREVGIRTVIGSRRRDLFLQFLIQYVSLSFLAIGLAIFILFLISAYFGAITDIPVSNLFDFEPHIWLPSLSFFVIGSALVGIYPVLYLIKINPVKAIKGTLGGAPKSQTLRKTLLIVQFTSSLVLIAFLLVVTKQLDFMQVTNKKIDLEKVITLKNPTAYADQLMEEKYRDLLTLENKLLQNPAIKMMASSSAIPGTEIGFTIVNNLKRSKDDPYSAIRYKLLFVDYNFVPLYNLKLLAGRNYSIDNGEAEKKGRIVLNESAIHALGFKSAEEAIGESVYLEIWDWVDPHYQIIGVVEDYHHEAIKKPVHPTIFWLNQRSFQAVYYSIKLNEGTNPQEAISFIEKSWKEIFPERPFDYFFLDSYYDQQFKSEKTFATIFGSFAGIAIFLAGLGILGMTLFEVNARLKEISIRKVLGATVANLVGLLSRKYFQLVILASLIAIPLTYFFAIRWLEAYPTRIEVNPIFFVLPLCILITVIMIASGFQTIKAANSNPVDYLKNE
jgi:putative ABC transport system permease protein